LTKHRYKVSGVACVGDYHFIGECISNDIINAILLFREHDNGLSVHSIERMEQVSADKEIGIISLNKVNWSI